MDLTEQLQDIHLNGKSSQKKRIGYLEWDEYFMALAFLAAKRSKDPVTQVGACVVSSDKTIVSLGYNGMPKGCDDDEFPWCKGTESSYDSKKLYVCHAEMNAIINKNSASVQDCTLYVSLFPCNECTKLIIQSGIKQVIYVSDKHSHKDKTRAAKRMLDSAKIEYRQFTPKVKNITIDFDEINHA